GGNRHPRTLPRVGSLSIGSPPGAVKGVRPARLWPAPGSASYGRSRALSLLRPRLRPDRHPVAVPPLPHEGELLRRCAAGALWGDPRPRGARDEHRVTAPARLVVRPERLLDVVGGTTDEGRCVLVEGDRVVDVLGSAD